MAKKFAAIIDAVNDWVGKIFSFGIFAMLLVMMTEVVSRYVIGTPTTWAWQVNGLLYSSILTLGGGYVLLHQGHVRLDALYERMSRRGQLISDIGTFPIFLIFGALVVWQASRLALDSLLRQEHTLGFFHAPVYVAKTAFFVAAILLLLQGIANLIKNIIEFRESRKDMTDAPAANS